MAIPREVVAVPRLRGLHDFPEVAPKGSAAESVNMEFADGGPRRRRGCVRMDKIIAGDADNIADGSKYEIYGKGIWSWTHSDGSQYLIVGYNLASGGIGSAHLRVCTPTGQTVTDFDLNTVDQPGLPGRADASLAISWPAAEAQRWDATVFHPGGLGQDAPGAVFVFATHEPAALPVDEARPFQQAAPSLWALWRPTVAGQGEWECRPIDAIDRDANVSLRYWGNTTGNMGVPSEHHGDDPGPYLGGTSLRSTPHPGTRRLMSGSFVQAYKNRLFVAGFYRNNESQTIRFSNLGDMDPAVLVGPRNVIDGVQQQRRGVVQGFPTNNVVHLAEGDPTEITGMCTWTDFLVVFKRRSVTLLAMQNSIDDMQVVKQDEATGHVGATPPVQVKTDQGVFLFFVGESGFYVWNGQAEYISGPIERRLRSDGGTRGTVMVSYPDKEQVWFHVPGNGNSPKSYVFDWQRKQWSTADHGGQFLAMCESFGTDARKSVPVVLTKVKWAGLRRLEHAHLGQSLLNIVRLDAGFTDEAFLALPGVNASDLGAAYSSRYETQRIAYGKFQPRNWRILRLAAEQSPLRALIDVYWCFDNQSREAAIANGQVTQVSFRPPSPGDEQAAFGAGVVGNAEFVWGDKNFHQLRIPMAGGKARWFRFGVECAGEVAVDAIEGLQLAVGVNKNQLVAAPLYHFNAAEIDTRRGEGRR